MFADRVRLQILLERLRDLESRQPAPHERAIFEASRIALCDAVSRLAHALHDTTYLRADDGDHRAAG